MDIKKVDIGTHDGVQHYDGQRLDRLYAYDQEARTVNQNPKKLMMKQWEL